ncbi:hypothetical protein ACFYE2_17160 [Kocuria sp. CPCC 205300]|uniref:hypothetical protein n=1 Tax=Kocuria sabuli TaxID=3071448 RepID=UPI0036DC81A1
MSSPRHPAQDPTPDIWQLLRLPLILTGVVTTISAVAGNWPSCCAGEANIGAGMPWLLGLALLAGGGLWGIVTVVNGHRHR